MTTLRRSIPSMSALATFESAARLGSFTQAAAELGVTQAAVSRQIKLLEQDLNAMLFVRANRKVVLTPSGAALAATVTKAFFSMAEMIETIRQPVTVDTVTVGASLAFSHFWILPRLPQFRAMHPDIKLRLIAEDNVTDLRHDRLDVAVRYGKPTFADARSMASHPDEVFAVCSPKLLQDLGFDAATVDLLNLPLIASDVINPSWMTWRSWAQEVGLGPALGKASDLSRLRFSHYSDTIQAAVSGEGMALGWATLLSGHLAEGRLVKVGALSLRMEERHHVLIPNGRDLSKSAKVFVDWIVASFMNGP